MEDKETINILIAQLLSKDDENLRLRNLLDDLQREQQSGNMQILSKLDRALEELKSMRHDNKALSNRLSQALEAKSAAEEKIQELSSALEALENTRADELYEIARQKRQLYGRKSEKKSSVFYWNRNGPIAFNCYGSGTDCHYDVADCSYFI